MMIFVYNFSIDDFKLKCNENEITTQHTHKQQQQSSSDKHSTTKTPIRNTHAATILHYQNAENTAQNFNRNGCDKVTNRETKKVM